MSSTSSGSADESELEALKAQLEAQTREATVLHRVSTLLNSSLRLDQRLADVLLAMDEFFGFRHAMVLLLDSDGETLSVAAHRGYDDAPIGAKVPLGVGVIGTVAKRRRMLRMNGLRSKRRYAAAIQGSQPQLPSLPGLPDADGQLAVPLLVEGDLIGVFSVESDQSIIFRHDDERLVGTVANHAASAIRNARMYDLLEDKVRQRTADLEQANLELRDAQSQLVQAGKMASLGELVAGVAHEINTPIGSVTSSSDTQARVLAKLRDLLTADGVLEREPGSQRLLRVMESSTEAIDSGASRVARIVKRLRAFARLDEADIQKVAIAESIGSALAMLEHEIGERIEVQTEFGETPSLTAQARSLNQVFLNLLTNAVQAIEGEGRITVKTAVEDERIRIDITDDGAGIPEDDLDRIFDPGFTTRGVGVGTGLGLSICYRIVQDHGGDISVQSKVGQGTTFTVRLSLDGLSG